MDATGIIDRSTSSDDTTSTDHSSSDPAESLRARVAEHRSVLVFTRIGWLAKGVVYLLMGFSALAIARQNRAEDQASPNGSLAKIAESTAGSLLIGVVAVGLALYAAWRLLSAVLVRGDDLDAWGHRIGYAFSSVVYVVLAWTAGSAAMTTSDPERSHAIETWSQRALEMPAGRWLLGVAGVATVGVALYFLIGKGVMRSFSGHLTGVDDDLGKNRGFDRVLVVTGAAGWIGRGLVTALVGVFVTRAAIQFDPNDARGFDRSLRHLAGSGTGALLVGVCAIGLIAYGLFCLLSFRRRTLADTT